MGGKRSLAPLTKGGGMYIGLGTAILIVILLILFL